MAQQLKADWFTQRNALSEALKALEMESRIKEQVAKGTELENQQKSFILDLLQGRGTPSQRNEELYRPVPSLAAALGSGQTISNIAPGGQYFGAESSGAQFPVQSSLSQMGDIVPAGASDPLIRAMVNKQMIGQAELPQEREQFELTKMKEGETFRAKLQEKAEVAREERQMKYLGSMEERRKAEEKRLGIAKDLEEVRKKRSATTLDFNKRLENIHKALRDPLMVSKDKVKEVLGEKQSLIQDYQDAMSLLNEEEHQIPLLYGEAGRPNAPQVGPPVVDPVEEGMKTAWDETERRIFTINYGLTPDLIRKKAAEAGATPEAYMRALKQALYAQGKGGK